MANKYLIRLDDACPTMDKAKWQRMEDILCRFGVRPLVGIIPNNEDPETSPDPEDSFFWEKAHKWENAGWAIALHGYNHVCTSSDGMNGLNPMWQRSEFAGLPLDLQKEKIRNGILIFKSHGFNPKYFFAPSHTYDKNTLEALRLESDIRIISDTIATKPYKQDDFVIIPQLGGHCAEMRIPGIWTFCLHPTAMNDSQFKAVEQFLEKHKDEFISFSDLELNKLHKKSIISKLLSFTYFVIRKLKGLK
jgi:predicted deacetylase